MLSAVLRPLLAGFIRRRIYLPEKVPAIDGDYGGVDFRRTVVETSDGLQIAGLRSRHDGPTRFTLLYFHGNGGCAAMRAHLVAPLCEQGADVIVASYRGYGDNPGEPSETGLMKDADAFRQYALDTAQGPLVLFGHSLGGAVAILLAADNPEGFIGLITLGTFANLRSRAPAYASGLLPDQFDGASRARDVPLPWAIMHEFQDEITSVDHANALFEASGKPPHVRLVLLEGGTHQLEPAKLSRQIDMLVGGNA